MVNTKRKASYFDDPLPKIKANAAVEKAIHLSKSVPQYAVLSGDEAELEKHTAAPASPAISAIIAASEAAFD